MTGFKVDYNEAQDFGSVADGLYEVVIFNVTEQATPGGAEFLNFDLIIRNDVPQKHANSHLFHKVWKSKETGKYNRGMIMMLAKSFKLPDGKSYATFQDFLNDFAFRTASVTVKNEQSEYKGKTYDNTNVKKFSDTRFPEMQHQFKNNNQSPSNESTPDIQDDDLPF